MFRYTKFTLIRELLVWVFSLILLSPLFLLVINSLKTIEEVTIDPLSLPKNAQFANFGTVLSSSNTASLPLGLLNSLIVTTIGVCILIVLGSVTAYVLARKMSRLSKAVFYGILVGIIVPAQLGIVPIFVGARSLGLLGNIPGLGVIYGLTLLPLAVFLYAGFVRSIPIDYEEAAFIDGSSKIRTFMRIVFPLLSPATGTVAIMAGIIMWNDFFTPLIFLNGSESPTIGLVIYGYASSAITTEWNLVFALLILAMLPVTALYLMFQKKFIQGFAGGIKS
ncbi:MAG: hypothetical protein RLZZ258_250 [Actinomycetota bacterium]|jgi:raffinose/stachyose/melibiose transport system permease protein